MGVDSLLERRHSRAHLVARYSLVGSRVGPLSQLASRLLAKRSWAFRVLPESSQDPAVVAASTSPLTATGSERPPAAVTS